MDILISVDKQKQFLGSLQKQKKAFSIIFFCVILFSLQVLVYYSGLFLINVFVANMFNYLMQIVVGHAISIMCIIPL